MLVVEFFAFLSAEPVRSSTPVLKKNAVIKLKIRHLFVNATNFHYLPSFYLLTSIRCFSCPISTVSTRN